MKQNKKPLKRKSRSTTKRTSTLRTHLIPSLLKFSAHRHTGKRLSHAHTSHGGLIVIVFLAGVALFSTLNTIKALGLEGSGSINVSVTVAGPAPSQPAVITSIGNGDVVFKKKMSVRGTAPANTMVVAYRNGIFAGSTWTSQPSFNLEVDLRPGENILQVQDYNLVNQSGPASDPVKVIYAEPVVQDTSPSNDQIKGEEPVVEPVAEVAPTVLPDLTEFSCNDPPTDPPTQLTLLVSCAVKEVYVGETVSLPVFVYGGVAPYSLLVNWDDIETPEELFTFAEAGRHEVQHTYKTGGIRAMTFHVSDYRQQTYTVQTIAAVKGQEDSPTIAAIIKDNVVTGAIHEFWLDASVPAYIAVTTLVLGFWVGDIFQRFVSAKPRRAHR